MGVIGEIGKGGRRGEEEEDNEDSDEDSGGEGGEKKKKGSSLLSTSTDVAAKQIALGLRGLTKKFNFPKLGSKKKMHLDSYHKDF